MSRRTTGTFLAALLAVLTASAIFAGTASATPAWYFEGAELVGTETIQGSATETSIEIPGLTTTCETAVFDMTIENVGGEGEGELTQLPFGNCSTNTVCTVELIEASGLPWASELVTVGAGLYIVLEGVEIGILYGNPLCALNEFLVEVEGSAGGLIDNGAESATFNPANFAATGTELTALASEVDWNGVFAMEATGAGTGQALTVVL
jgi:hypothetical protein